MASSEGRGTSTSSSYKIKRMNYIRAILTLKQSRSNNSSFLFLFYIICNILSVQTFLFSLEAKNVSEFHMTRMQKKRKLLTDIMSDRSTFRPGMEAKKWRKLQSEIIWGLEGDVTPLSSRECQVIPF